jgi:hypothetical protein
MERMGKLARPGKHIFALVMPVTSETHGSRPRQAPKMAMSRLEARVPNPSNAVVIAVTTPVPHSWCCARADDGSVFP